MPLVTSVTTTTHAVRLLIAISFLSLCTPLAAFADDLRSNFPPSAAVVQDKVVPNLAALRAGALRPGRLSTNALRTNSTQTPPVPGGIGAGTIYKQGALGIESFAELEAQMIVHPEGINIPDFLFTTATNRTEKTIEVVGIYIGTGASLGIFDWSCLPDYPCPNGSTGPDWQWMRDLKADLVCYYTEAADGGGNLHNALSYFNISQGYPDGGTTSPVVNWRNSVLLLNSCTGQWDLVYSHDFRAVQKDCSIDQSCGWWGPILENFNVDPQPPIKPLGFLQTFLNHDNRISWIDTTDTSFSQPIAPWMLFYMDGASSWVVGSTGE